MPRLVVVMAAAIAAAITTAPTPALAHASAVAVSPAQGAVLTSSPSLARVNFNESVTGGSDAVRVVNSAGKTMSSAARVVGSIATAPVSRLSAGRYAVTWNVVSEDGHRVTQASGFSVALRDPVAEPVTLSLSGRSIDLSGDRVGTRTLALGGTLKRAIGQVEWRFPGMSAPFVWKLSAGRATGMLPFAGTYSVTIRAYSSATSSTTLTGPVRIRS